MTELEPSAKAWMDAVQVEVPFMNRLSVATVALERALLEIEVKKHELRDFKQKVSDECAWILAYSATKTIRERLSRFIIPKPDPLTEVLWDLGMANGRDGEVAMANRINDALKARNLKIVEVKNDD
jgi:hypothetical protein